MDLKHLTDKTLLLDALEISREERRLTTKMLHYLKEIDSRKLYSDLGYNSMFAYCVQVLKYSESAALRRIKAARLLNELPEVEEKIDSGALNLSNLNLFSGFIKGKTSEEKLMILSEVENLSTRGAEKRLFELTGGTKNVKEKETKVSSEAKAVTLVLKDRTLLQVQEFKALSGIDSWDGAILKMCTIALLEIKKEKFKLTERSHASSVGKGRYVSASVKREVYKRDQACQKCGTLFRLHFDHRKPYALGGENTAENIRLLCFNCNQRSRIRQGL